MKSVVRISQSLGLHIVKRLVVTLLLLSPLFLSLSSCDLSVFFAKNGSGTPGSTTTGGGGGSGATYVQSYVITAAANAGSGLTADATAVITGTNIYITLPYSIIQTQTKLIPTITMQSGYTMAGTAAPFVQNDGMILVVTKTSDASIYNYTLHVAVDPTSLAYLKLANAFYYDTTGTKRDLSANSTITLDAKTNTYTVTLNTDSFNLSYVQYAVQAILSRPIGFATANVAYGSFGDVSPVFSGSVPPYTITVQSPDKSVTNTFLVKVARTLSSNIAVTDASAVISYVYDYQVSRAAADATVANWLSAQFNVPDNNGHGTLFSDYAGYRTNYQVFSPAGGSFGMLILDRQRSGER